MQKEKPRIAWCETGIRDGERYAVSQLFEYDDGGRSKYFEAPNVGDCVVRAIAIAAQRDYKEVYDELHAIMKAKGDGSPRNGVPRKIMKRYLLSHGWTWVPTMHIGQGCKTHLREDELPSGKLIVSLSKHITAVVDGVIRDNDDPSRAGTRCVYGYFTRNND